MNIYMTFVAMDNEKYSYSDMMIKCAKSLIKCGFNESDIVCLVHGKDVYNKTKKQLSKSIIVEVPQKQPKGMKGWFFKVIAHHYFLNNSLVSPYLYCMCDVDTIFYSNPTPLLEKQSTDVWAQRRERYLRPSNKERLLKKNPNYINPKIDNIEELTAYMGRARAYLFTKYGMNKVPEFGLYSDFVSIKDNIHHLLVSKWYEMFNDISQHTEFCTGDQEILDAAMHYLNLSFSFSGAEKMLKHYQSGEKKKIVKK